MTDSTDAPQPLGPFLRDYPAERGFRHVGARTVSVVLHGNGSYTVKSAHGSETHGRRPLLGKSDTVCEIALGKFQSKLELPLPAAGGATFFDAVVDIHWRVEDPYLVAKAVIRDVVLELEAPILERLREITQNYPVQAAKRANDAVTAECSSGRWNDLGDPIGLWTRLYVRLNVDQRAVESAAILRAAQEEHLHKSEQERLEAERLGLRMQRFRGMLEGGQLDQLSYVMADSPGEAAEFLEKLRLENREDHLRLQGHVLDMIDSGRLHSADLEQQMRTTLAAHSPYSIDGPLGPHTVRRDNQPQPALEQGDGTAREPVDAPWWLEADGPEPQVEDDPDDGWSWAGGGKS